MEGGPPVLGGDVGLRAGREEHLDVRQPLGAAGGQEQRGLPRGVDGVGARAGLEEHRHDGGPRLAGAPGRLVEGGPAVPADERRVRARRQEVGDVRGIALADGHAQRGVAVLRLGVHGRAGLEQEASVFPSRWRAAWWSAVHPARQPPGSAASGRTPASSRSPTTSTSSRAARWRSSGGVSGTRRYSRVFRARAASAAATRGHERGQRDGARRRHRPLGRERCPGRPHEDRHDSADGTKRA